jgi:hypothetical protein
LGNLVNKEQDDLGRGPLQSFVYGYLGSQAARGIPKSPSHKGLEQDAPCFSMGVPT